MDADPGHVITRASYRAEGWDLRKDLEPLTSMMKEKQGRGEASVGVFMCFSSHQVVKAFPLSCDLFI